MQPDDSLLEAITADTLNQYRPVWVAQQAQRLCEKADQLPAWYAAVSIYSCCYLVGHLSCPLPFVSGERTLVPKPPYGDSRRWMMSRRKKDPLRPFTDDEQTALEQLSRAQSAPATQVIRAKLLLAVAAGLSYLDAAHAVGRRSNDAVSRLVSRFNHEGLAAVHLRHGGGPSRIYGPAERARILAEVLRTPDRARDGTATWSLTTLQHALRTAPDGLPKVSTFVILAVLHDAGFTWQRNRTWCDTGTVVRQRKAGLQQVTDPDAHAKKC